MHNFRMSRFRRFRTLYVEVYHYVLPYIQSLLTCFRTLYVEVYQHKINWEWVKEQGFRTLYVEVYLVALGAGSIFDGMFPYIIC